MSAFAAQQQGTPSRHASTPRHRPFAPAPARVARGSLAVVKSGGVGAASTEAPSLEDLRSGLQAAIKAEDYATAARIRDRIAELEQADPVVQAQRELEAAVAEERFEVWRRHACAARAPCSRLSDPSAHTHAAPAMTPQDAARLRDTLSKLRPPPLVAPTAEADPAFDPTATTVSECVTDGVRVTCRSFYVPTQSNPARSTFFFG